MTQYYVIKVDRLKCAQSDLELVKKMAEGSSEPWKQASVQQRENAVKLYENMPEDMRCVIHSGGRGNGACGGLYVDGQVKRILGRYPKGAATAVPVAIGVVEPPKGLLAEKVDLPTPLAEGLSFPELAGRWADSASELAPLLNIHQDDLTDYLIDCTEEGGKHDCTEHCGFLPLVETPDGGLKGYHVNYSCSYSDGVQGISLTGPDVRRVSTSVQKAVSYGKP